MHLFRNVGGNEGRPSGQRYRLGRYLALGGNVRHMVVLTDEGDRQFFGDALDAAKVRLDGLVSQVQRDKVARIAGFLPVEINWDCCGERRFGLEMRQYNNGL